MRQHPRAVSHAGASTPASHKRTAQKWGHPGGAILTPRLQAKMLRLPRSDYWDTSDYWILLRHNMGSYLSILVWHFFLINIFSPFQFFQKNNGFTTKCRGSSLEESAMGLGNFTTNCLALESPFFDQISIFIHGPRYFFLQSDLPSKVEVGLGPFHKVASLQNDP